MLPRYRKVALLEKLAEGPASSKAVASPGPKTSAASPAAGGSAKAAPSRSGKTGPRSNHAAANRMLNITGAASDKFLKTTAANPTPKLSF
jgi:hypothetical protein